MKTHTNGSVPYTPHEYQRQGIRLVIGQGAAGLLLDPGLGKTSIIAAAMKILFGKGMIKGVLVIGPLRVILNVWPDELRKWKDFEDMTFGILHGPDKLETLRGPQKNFYFVNPDRMEWLWQALAQMKEWPFDVLVVDESTKFKASNSQRFKMLRGQLNRFRRRYILTGTPAPNGLLDLFGQIFILDQGHALGAYITHYRNNYFYPSGYGGYTWTPRETAMAEISERIAPLTLRMRAQDYLTLPPLINRYHWMDLPDEVRHLYSELEDHFIAELGDDTILAPSAAAAGVKCRQILNGAVYIDEEHNWKLVHDTKMDALDDLLEELGHSKTKTGWAGGQPLLILYEFNHDRERLIEHLGWGAIGQQSDKKDAVLIKNFNSGLLSGLIGHPASMGHGLNLQGSCAHVCWFGLTWNLEHYDQAIRRVWRQGNTAPRVLIHHLCIRNSLDDSVVGTLRSKDKTQTTLMESIRRLHKP